MKLLEFLEAIDDEMRHTFTCGSCAFLALSLHKKYGWPMAGTFDIDPETGEYDDIHHIWVEVPGTGKAVDINGVQDSGDLMRVGSGEYGYDISPEWVEDFIHSWNPTPQVRDHIFQMADTAVKELANELRREGMVTEQTGPSVAINYNGVQKRAVKPPRARRDVLMTIPTRAMDEAFQRDRGYYVGPQGSGAAIGDRYRTFAQWIEENNEYRVPEVYVDERGIMTFDNGRHRYAVLRDAGVDPMPVAMAPEAVRNAQQLLKGELREAIEYRKPRFDVEWEEAQRYPFLRRLGPAGWNELANSGRAVSITKNDVGQINNTDAMDHDAWDQLEPEKRERFVAAFRAGQIEMPIVMNTSGGLELIAGNTRLTGMIQEAGKATVWLIDVTQ